MIWIKKTNHQPNVSILDSLKFSNTCLFVSKKLRFLLSVSHFQLIHAGFHLGGSSKVFFNSNTNYWVGYRGNFYIPNLSYSLVFVRRGLMFISKACYFLISVLFLSSDVERKDYLSSRYLVSMSYIPGILTNYRSVGRLKSIPGFVCLADTKNSAHGIRECLNLDLPFFGPCDSEMDANDFFFPIFGNNDSVEVVKLLFYMLKDTIYSNKLRFFNSFCKLGSIYQEVA